MPQGGSFDLLLKMRIGFPLIAVHGSRLRLYFSKKFLFSYAAKEEGGEVADALSSA